MFEFYLVSVSVGVGSDGTSGGERRAGSAQNEQLLHVGPGGTRPSPDGKKPNRAQQAATAHRAGRRRLASKRGAHQPSLRPHSSAAPHVWSRLLRGVASLLQQR
jgi:hypothetical protein